MNKIRFIFIFFVMNCVFGQNLTTILDKEVVKIGEENSIIIKITPLQSQEVRTMPKNELLPFHMEEISDSISIRPYYFRKIKFAIYDFGEFKIPSLEFKIGDRVLKSIEHNIKVLPTKRSNKIDDIMNIKEVDLSWQDYWEMYKFYVLGILLMVAIIFLAWKFFTKGKKAKVSPEIIRNRFLKKIKEIEDKNYLQNQNYRSFYIEIVDVCRDFIDFEYKFPAKILFSEDLFDLMHQSNKISEKNQKQLEQMFDRAEAMKFAIKIPSIHEMQNDLEFMKLFVKNAHIEIENENLRSYE